MICQPIVRIYAVKTQVLSSVCGEDKPRNSLNGLPSKPKTIELGCGTLSAVTIEKQKDGYRSTPLGSAAPNLIVMVKLSWDVFSEMSNKLYCLGDAGFAWPSFDGAIEDVRQIGTWLRLLVNPANKLGGLCRRY
jgi:hypothetical protein